jgi:nitroreductase
MDLLKLIKQRKSIRAFTKEVPPRQLILECLETASWAPNPTSQQPWQFIVLSGNSLIKVSEIIKESYSETAGKTAPQLTEKSEGSRILEQRKKENFSEMLGFLKEHNADMTSLGEGNFNFHRAPLAIIFATYPYKDQNYIKSTISAMQTFMLAATALGLGTCWANAVSVCQDAIKKELGLQDELILVDGISIGYPDLEAPINNVPRHRLPIEQVVSWLE